MSEQVTRTTRTLSRRTIVKGAAWSLPVIAAAAAVPLASASTKGSADPVVTCGSAAAGDNGSYTISGERVIVSYDSAPDVYELNAHFRDGTSASYGTNDGTAPAQGSQQWSVETGKPVAWVQVHSFNTHYQNGVCQ
ncbi:hypothetical protein [Microbacterium azadirachtae]|uniref:Uncharacterized protein n=1 Tax=Microbacterium azadirachtae TaxID=582680 RepID=A0A0F0LI26_9MICO|nr:hypothetical protein [Microbacterium azadirachtae]KJL32793.1 hypothetical protein RL72_00145 [Microbacterium azadirachtae]UXW86280.1 hypothetical protein NFX31_01690 [Microbacterium azadirachtae]SDL57696.1 hypothetical protein SAMN04488593_1198 [Microbacterium azadirachtae]SEF86529.1 hypothetical protein SAMN04488594_1185 [Microbacterium azadirachtae]SEF88404.1 hypothetical protein SAMN04488592_1195 [Microbacterium azadirachtae]